MTDDAPRDLAGELRDALAVAASRVRSLWRPEGLTSTRPFAPNVSEVEWAAVHNGQPQTGRISAQRIGYRRALPVDVEARTVDGGEGAIHRTIGYCMRATEDLLRRDTLVADADGLTVEVVVIVNGRAWPAVPGVTTPDEPADG